mgnify:CR=1 FL=1
MNNKSILLNGSFFQDDHKRKIEKLNELDIKSVYVFDHNVNPEKRDSPVYKLTEAISNLNSYERNFDIGTMVLNIRKRRRPILFNKYILPFLEISNFNLGIGIGDQKYEKQDIFYQNNIEQVIKEIIKDRRYLKNNINLIIGGSSNMLKDLSLKYSLGINQWQGSIDKLIDNVKIFENTNKKNFRVSYCTKNFKFTEKDVDINLGFEIIYVLSESKSFDKQIDEIQKHCLN